MNRWVLGIVGTEALVIVFLCTLYLIRVYRQSKLTPNAVFSTIIRQGFTFPLAICFTFIILAALLLANVAHANTVQLLTICWVLNSWLITKQMDFAHSIHQQDRAAAAKLIHNKIALTQASHQHDALSLASEDHPVNWDIYLGIPKDQSTL
ncbi:hypothetical protein K493DRAFT_313901 [Basidiobolus meristosporus CBS 931.73]|uniref:Uncharacterized protein n=1 Tax=Basidiobolus meristosporus CBS 931.73 TaxID=1314790 RepID=A0A1Y1YIM3_9FUNG|nr:hypothetical protein K493DRAFT_313901 [Basidiobolus meristosporus CBS 931.73]|eukprot:ORX97891.1 hypothetical protein K493DRAFT_313901 [Basidiobolus meristosporus CBS 931.73]